MSAPAPTLASLSPQALRARLSGGARYRVGPFQFQVQTDVPALATLLHRLYGNCALAGEDAVSDFQVSLKRARGPRRWVRPWVEFVTDQESPFSPLPLHNAFPLLEWGLNWCVATNAHQFLMLHAAVIERGGRAILMPALPGSGKSTLCAALVHRGWRLLSDEFGLVRPGTTRLVPFPRCIPLKNESIELMRRLAPEAVIGPTFYKTRKGDVAHVMPPPESTRRDAEDAAAGVVVFPQYVTGATSDLRPIAKARAFMKLSTNSFNYATLGADGFRTVAKLIDASDCFLLRYSEIEDVARIFSEL